MTVAHRSSPDPKKNLVKELASVGLRATAASQVLPEWWQEAVLHPSGVYEVRGFVAKHFGLEIGPDGYLRQRLMPPACFKTRTGTDITEVASARALATAVARLVAGATINPWRGNLPAATNLRSNVIEDWKRPWVALSDLLAICWAHGVPVIYLPALPVNKPKMEGMVTYCGGRPVILVTKKAQSAWILFILAHEMGHLALGHLDKDEGGAIVDENVSEHDEDVRDPQEVEANAFALQLLTGGDRRAISLKQWVNASALAEAAIRFGREHKIDPGHVILNAIKNTKAGSNNLWPLAQAALKYLSNGGDTSATCRAALRKHLNLDAFSADSFEFLERLGVL